MEYGTQPRNFKKKTLKSCSFCLGIYCTGRKCTSNPVGPSSIRGIGETRRYRQWCDLS